MNAQRATSEETDHPMHLHCRTPRQMPYLFFFLKKLAIAFDRSQIKQKAVLNVTSYLLERAISIFAQRLHQCSAAKKVERNVTRFNQSRYLK